MPKFAITFEREVIQTDRFTRIVEADTLEEAEERGREAAPAYDHDCPDDATGYGSDECQSWRVFGTAPAADDAAVDDLPGDLDD